MRKTSSIVLGAALFVAAVPAFAGIHYKSTTKSEDARGRSNEVQVEGWVSGEKARVEFKDSTSPNPFTQKGTYLLTQDGGKTLYLVNPEEKTYSVLDLNAMLGAVGTVMNGLGPLLKIQFSEPKVEKLADEDGGRLRDRQAEADRVEDGVDVGLGRPQRPRRQSAQGDVRRRDEARLEAAVPAQPAQLGRLRRRCERTGHGERRVDVSARPARRDQQSHRRSTSPSPRSRARSTTGSRPRRS